MNDQALPDSIPGSDRPDFIVETTNTEADFLTLFGVLMPPLFTVGYPVLGIVSLGFGVFLTALSGAGFLSFLCIISGILLLILRAIYPKRAVKRQCARLRES